MKRCAIACICLLALSLSARPARADELEQGRQLLAAGQLEAAAEFFSRFAAAHPNDANAMPEALAACGRILDVLADSLTGAAEKRCYWVKGGGGSPACMQRETAALNARFGDGAFRYEGAINYFLYAGSHYRQILSRFPSNAFAAEAEFYLLLHELTGLPDAVLPRVKAFLAKYPSGPWHRRGLLLWARVNRDIWYVHRKWSWVLYNDVISEDELVIRSEPYRQEALRTYQQLMKEKGTFEGSAAAREGAMLAAHEEEGNVISIVSDSTPGTLATWGVEAPAPVSAPSSLRPSMPPPAAPKPSSPAAPVPPPSPKAPVPAATVAPEAPAPTQAPAKRSSPPSRWQ